jgi:hypothetical protein
MDFCHSIPLCKGETMTDPEIKAITEIAKAFTDLTDDQLQNVLLYINARYGTRKSAAHQRLTGFDSASPMAATEHESIGDFFDAAAPQTEAERVLSVAYWTQVIEGASDFEAFPVSKHLKHLGHPVSNITRALDSMIHQTPRLIIQTNKSGRTKQARKRYKVTREGIKRVQSMLMQSSGDDNGN